ncbi:MAG TPA: nucleotidyltransferase substrate binding protein [Pseudobdellovibrionaceae bacterium]|jgi:nucleotidyltransferase substrate binding protein (TIGR01987 family)
MAVSVQELTKALESLRIALESPYSDIVRDASIQRFEFCIELCWKLLKKKMGTSSVAPKAVLREAAAQGLIANIEIWFDFIEARNLTSHTYNESVAKTVFETVQRFFPEATQLLTKLNSI